MARPLSDGSVTWKDILSDSSWQSIDSLMKLDLATCVTKGHLLSQTKGVTRIFGDYSAMKKGNRRNWKHNNNS